MQNTGNVSRGEMTAIAPRAAHYVDSLWGLIINKIIM